MGWARLALNLLMTGIAATDDTDLAMATDHLAGTANAADGCADFHLLWIACLGNRLATASAVAPATLSAVNNATAGEVVGRQFDGYGVSGSDANVVHAHFSRDVSKNLLAVLELDIKRCAREGFPDHSG